MTSIDIRWLILLAAGCLILAAAGAAIRADSPDVGALMAQDAARGGVDVYGDSLPPGAVARLGTIRLRHAGADNSHGACATCLAFAPSGKAVATGGGEGTVRIWDVETGKELLRLQGHKGPISSVAYSPDGTLITSGGGDTMVWSRMLADGDRTVRLWEAATGRELQALRGHQRGVTAVAIAPDGKSVASGSLDGTVRIWDVATGQEISSWTDYPGGVSSLLYMPDGRSLLTADGAHMIRIREIAGGKETLRIPLKGRKGKWPNVDVSNISLSRDGQTIVSVDGENLEKTARIWDVATAKELPITWQKGEDHFEVIYAAILSPDGKSLATRGGAGNVHLWDPATGRKLRDFRGHEYDVMAMAFSPDGSILATGDDDRTIRFWNVSTGKEIEKAQAHGAWVEAVAFSRDGKTVATTAGDSSVRLWDPATGRALRRLELPGRQNWGKRVFYSTDGRILAAFGTDGRAHFWEAATGNYLRALQGTPPEINGAGRIEALALSPDGKSAALASFGTVRILDAGTGQELCRLKDTKGYVSWMSFSPDRRLLITLGSVDGQSSALQYWDPSSGELLRAMPQPDKGFLMGAYSGDGRLLAVGSMDGTIRLVEFATGKDVLKLKGHSPKHAQDLCFSPDGRVLASGGYDHTARLWDTSDGRELGKVEGHAEYVKSVAFSPDGKLLATASGDTTALIWDITGIRAGKGGDAVPEGQFESLWADLADAVDAPKAYRAAASFLCAENGAVPFLKEHLLRPAGDAKRTRELLTTLEHEDPAERDKAAAELEQIGEEKILRDSTVQQTLSLDARTRLASVIKKLESPLQYSGTALRENRAIGILARLGTPEAHAALEEIARKAAESRRSREARAALDRARR